MPATPKHHTATTDASWDGPQQVDNLKTPLSKKVGDDTFAWLDSAEDFTTKQAWKLPHHEVDSGGTPGAANVKGCTSAIGVLNGAMGGIDIPDADREAVYGHLIEHLKDAGVADLPELKSASPIKPEQRASLHAPMTGTHSHSHSAMGSQGGDETHDHEHSHEGDADHDHHTQANAKPHLRLTARAARAELKGEREVRTLTFSRAEVREAPDGSGRLRFSGCASSTESPYEMWDMFGPYTEVIRSGAFKKTIGEKSDIYMLGYHDPAMPVAGYVNSTLTLREVLPAEVGDGEMSGLMVDADLDPADPDVQALAAKLRSGLLNKMSFAFRVVRQQWSPDYEQRDILEVELFEVSVVTWPANPNTSAQMLSREAAEIRTAMLERVHNMIPTARLRSFRDRVLGELREGKTLSADTLSTLQQVLDLIAAADDAVDEAQPLLAGLMGVPNPDDDKDDTECPSCGAMNDSEAKYCDACGVEMASAAPNDDDPDSLPDDDGSLDGERALALAQAQAMALRLRGQRLHAA